MNLISVIVPVYNVEKYLDRCISSIINQTYQNLEIILVDDGSSDNCPAMCDKWAMKDSRIRVIHKQNGGLSDARNAGMKIATGEYVGFVDSDDYISPHMYQFLLERMNVDNSDIAICGVEMLWENNSFTKMLTSSGNFLLNTQEALLAIVEESKIKHPVWNRLYKAKCLSNIFFPVGKTHEDAFWSYKVIANAKLITVLDCPCYFYLQRPSSIMGQQYSDKRLDLLDAYWNEIEFLSINYAELLPQAITLFCFRLLYHYQSILKLENNIDRNRCLARIKPHHESWKQVCSIGIPQGIKQWIWYNSARLSLGTTAYIRNILKVGI
jgi:glycosyltransferase involved in cell wall biosynthesis